MKRVMVLFLCMGLSLNVKAQNNPIDPGLNAAIAELIDITGVSEIGEQFADLNILQMVESLRQQQPDLPEQAFEIIREEAKVTFSGEIESGKFEAHIIPLSAKYFNFAEDLQLLAFYQPPLGRKTVEIKPMLSQGSIQLGRAHGIGPAPII